MKPIAYKQYIKATRRMEHLNCTEGAEASIRRHIYPRESEGLFLPALVCLSVCLSVCLFVTTITK